MTSTDCPKCLNKWKSELEDILKHSSVCPTCRSETNDADQPHVNHERWTVNLESRICELEKSRVTLEQRVSNFERKSWI